MKGLEKIELDIDVDNDEVSIEILNVNLDIKLAGKNWSNIEGIVKVESINMHFYISDIEKKDQKLAMQLLKVGKTIDELKTTLQTVLLEVPIYFCAIHDFGWEIYNDKAFEKAISDYLGWEIMFTEQGMQENNIASLEN